MAYAQHIARRKREAATAFCDQALSVSRIPWPTGGDRQDGYRSGDKISLQSDGAEAPRANRSQLSHRAAGSNIYGLPDT